jgi:outer membrane PBP1 activator LpoA protein
VPPERLELDGATGHLSLDASHQFVREAMLMQFRGGQIVPAGAR